MRIAITLVLILVTAGVGAFFALDRVVSRENLRAQLVEQAEASSGQIVQVAGRMDVSLLPRPVFSFGETRFLGAGAGRAPVLDVDRIDLAVAPFALLRGEVEVEEVRLVRPRLRLPAPDQQPVGLLQLLAARAPVDLPGGLDRLSVVDGEILIGGIAQNALILRRVDLELGAEADRGPFFVHGTFVRADQPFVVEARLGRLTADPNTTLSFDLRTGADAVDAFALNFQGIVSLDRLTFFRGEARLAGSRLDAALDLLGPPLALDPPVPLAVPFELRGVIESDAGHGRISDLGVRLGTVEGSGRLDFAFDASRRIDLALEIPRFDTASKGLDLELLEAAAALGAGLEGAIDLTIPALIHDDLQVRDVRLSLGLRPQGDVLVHQSRAVLPGDTDVLIEGRLGGANGPAFEGRLSAVTDRVGELLAWLRADLPLEVADRFRTMSGQAEVVAAPDRVELHALDARLDATRVAGDMEVAFGERPQVRASLELDRLSLERYLPRLDVETVAAGLLAPLRSTDLTLELGLERLSAAGLRWSDVALAVEARGGRILLDRLEAGLLADTRLRVSGEVDPAREEADLSFAVTSSSPGPLVRRLGARPAFSLERLGDLEIEGTLQGWTGSAAIDARTSLGRVRSDVRGRAGMGKTSLLTVDLDVELAHPHYAGLLADLGLGDPAAGEDPLAGALKMRRRAGGEIEVVGHVGLGESRLTGQVEYAPGMPRGGIVGRLSLADPKPETLLPLAALAGYRLDGLRLARPVPGAWPAAYLDPRPLRRLDGRVEVSGKSGSTRETGFEALFTSEAGVIRLQSGVLRLGEGEGEVALDASLDVAGEVPAMTLAVEVKDLALDGVPPGHGYAGSLSGRLDLYGELRASGHTLPEFIRSSAGDVALSIRDGEVALPAPQGAVDPAPRPVPLDLLEAQFDIGRGLAEVTRLDLDTAEGTWRGDGLVDLLIWMADLTLVDRDGGRRIELVGAPGDIRARLRDLEARAPAE